MKKSSRFYRFCFVVCKIFFNIFYGVKYIGTERIPDEAVLICANHSGYSDPFLVAMAFGDEKQVHILAKAEVFKIPVISQILKKLGMIGVVRGTSDVKSIKTILRYLKDNERVAMFPEGTRSRNDDEVTAKVGAIRIAERAGVPIVPVFVPRKKPLFKPLTVVIGEKYLIPKTKEKRTTQDYSTLADALMEKIKNLNPTMETSA